MGRDRFHRLGRQLALIRFSNYGFRSAVNTSGGFEEDRSNRKKTAATRWFHAIIWRARSRGCSIGVNVAYRDGHAEECEIVVQVSVCRACRLHP